MKTRFNILVTDEDSGTEEELEMYADQFLVYRDDLRDCMPDVQFEILDADNDGVADNEQYAICEKHGIVKVIEAGSSPGYCSAIYWAKLSCGCHEVDASGDVPEM
jgi:hypothetical protein